MNFKKLIIKSDLIKKTLIFSLMFAKKYKFNGFILLLASYIYYIRNNQKDILNLTYN
jgi:hypothetical protein